MDCKKTFRDDGVVELICSGDFSSTYFLLLIKQVVLDSGWKPGTQVLVDFRDVNFNQVQFNDVIMSISICMHTQFNELIGNSKIAAIHSSENGLRLGKIYEEMAGMSVKSRINTFFNYDDANEWILESEYS